MPVADFAGEFGWGYDGVNLFAPTRNYGTPDDFRSFVDKAHALKIGVILDVVYNHAGPDGNYLPRFSGDYFSKKHKTDWGAAIRFDGQNCEPVREFYVSNAAYWIKEYHLDGLRLDATQSIHDRSPEHILAAIGRRVSTLCKGEDGLHQQLGLYHVYYNFCLPHASLRLPLPQSEPTHGNGSAKRWQPQTPARAAGLTDHVWTLREVLLFRVPPWPQPAGV